MKTLAQSWRDRLAELRAVCRANGEKLPLDLRASYGIQHVGTWWAEFCRAAENGDDTPAAVWSSAEKLGAKRMPGYVSRLRVRNRARRTP